MTKTEKRKMAELMARARNEYFDALYAGDDAERVERLRIISDTMMDVGVEMGCDIEYYIELTPTDCYNVSF